MNKTTQKYVEQIKQFVRDYHGTFNGSFLAIPLSYRGASVRLALKQGVIEKTGQVYADNSPVYRVGEKFLVSESIAKNGALS